MSRFSLKTRKRQVLVAPGTIVPNPESPAPVLKLIAYDEDRVEEAELKSPSEALNYIGSWRNVWIDVDGLGHAETLSQLARNLDIHRLALEDVVNTHQRPKVDAYGGTYFVVLRMVSDTHGATEQVSLFFGPGFVVSFNEHRRDCFEPFRRRIRENLGRARIQGPDYLLYSLMDSVVDTYFPRLDALGERLEELEEKVLREPSTDNLNAIHTVRHELLGIRRIMGATRETLNSLVRDTGKEIDDTTRLYLRDCYDHTIQILDIIESQREIASGLIETHLSAVSNRMNEIMKVLTIIATIFIPLTFIVGVYGMNFDTEGSPWNMPELEWAYGYPAVWGLMLLVVAGELFYFWRKGWLWEKKRPDDAGD